MGKQDSTCGCGTNDEPQQQPVDSGAGKESESSLFSITKMDCPTEESLIRAKLTPLEGIYSLDFNLVQRTLRVGHAPGMQQQILDILAPLDLDARIASPSDTESAPPAAKANWWILGAAGLAALAAELVFWLQGGNNWLVMLLALGAIAGGGFPPTRKAGLPLRTAI